jgi:NADH-quinone oxidoreductase subunit G
MEYRGNNQKENFDNVNSIVFSADITNEEAGILQRFKAQQNKRLICPEAKGYHDFLKAYSSSSGYHIFKGDLDTLDISDVVISFGVWFQDESTESISSVRKTLEEKKAKFIYMHPIEDASLQDSIAQFIKYEVGSEEGVAALLAYTLLEEKELSEEIEEILEELDIGYLSAESSIGEEELESMYGFIDEKSTVSLIVGNDLYAHPKVDQIAKLIGLVEKHAGVNVVCLPPSQNALGVAMICQLDDKSEDSSMIYESCLEGTYVNANRCLSMDDRKQPSEIDGLNSLASSLGLDAKSLVEYHNQLPQDQGFQTVCESDFTSFCIYKLAPKERKKELILDEIDDLPVYDGALVYTYPVEKMMLEENQNSAILYGSNQFAMATKLQDGDLISYEIEGVKFRRVFKIDTHMKGVIALNPISAIKLSAYLISSYRFSRLAFEKINNQNIGNNDE